MENYHLILQIKNKKLTPREYITKSKEILIFLEGIDPIFDNLFGWGTTEKSRKGFKEDKSDFEDRVFEQIKNDEIRYYNNDPDDEEIRLHSTSWLPYGNSYSNTSKAEDGQITVSFSMGGSDDDHGNFFIDFPKNNKYPQFSHYDFVKGLLVKCMSLFEVTYGVVISNEFRCLVKKKNQKDLRWVGWMTFIKDKDNGDSVFDLILDDLVSVKEKINQGTLIILSKKKPVDEVEIIKNACKVRDIMFQNDYLGLIN